MRRSRLLLATVAAAALGVAAAVVTEPGPADAVDASRVIGRYRLKLKGDGFDRDGQSLRYRRNRVRGLAVLTISRPEAAANARQVEVEIVLDPRLNGSVLDRATPTPALRGTGLLVEDSLTVIGSGQANFVNAMTLRFRKKGARVSGWWLASFPAAALDAGFAGGVGLQVVGRLQSLSPVQPVPLAIRDADAPRPSTVR